MNTRKADPFLGAVILMPIIFFSLANAAAAFSLRHDESGIASVYSPNSGTKTTSGEQFNSERMTAAHRSLPFGTSVRVTNTQNGRSTVVRINDRGPFLRGRIIDLTPAAAQALGFSGLASVTIFAE